MNSTYKKAYLSLTINERINVKNMFLNSYNGFNMVLEETALNPNLYYKKSPFLNACK